MSDTSQLQWWVDTRELDRFNRFVERKHGATGPFFPIEMVQAVRSYLDKDRAAELEEKIEALDETLADALGDYSRRRKTSSDPFARDSYRDETTKIRTRVPASLKEDFKIFVDEHSELSYGEALDRAMSEYRDGGREQRLADELEEITAEVAALQDSSDDVDDAATPYSVDEKVEAITADVLEKNGLASAADLDQIPKRHVVESIDHYCARDADQASDRTRSKYLERITDELQLAEHPSGKLLERIDDDSPLEDRPFSTLSSDERDRVVRKALIRRAKSGKGAQLSAAQIADDVFSGEPSNKTAHSLRDRVADADGFGPRTGEDGEKKVYVNTDRVDPELLEDVVDELQDSSDIEDAATEEMDALMNARVATDGGIDQ